MGKKSLKIGNLITQCIYEYKKVLTVPIEHDCEAVWLEMNRLLGEIDDLGFDRVEAWKIILRAV